jgi:hypothetical protein
VSVLWVDRAGEGTRAAINTVGSSGRGADRPAARAHESGSLATEPAEPLPGSLEELDEVSEPSSPDGKEATE